MQEINLDWILTKIKNILRFVPDDGAVGQILRRTAHGAEWSDEQGAGGSVTSVNGMQGAVVLTAADVGALPDTYAAPVDSVNGQTGAVVLSIPSDTSDLTNTAGFVDAAGAAAAAPVQSVNGQTGAVIVSGGGAVDSVNGQTGTVVLGKSDVGLGNVDNVQQYSASNPPPYPVTSVNGQTGDVVITPGGSFSPTLLWTNSTPNGSFSAQTIPLDLSGYSFVMIEYGVDGVGTLLTSFLPVPTLPPPAGYSSYNELQGIYVTGSNGRMAKRYLQITSTGVTFGGGTRFDSYNNSNSGDNYVCIPSRIWGI